MHLTLCGLQEQAQLVVDADRPHFLSATLVALESWSASDEERRHPDGLYLVNRDELERGLAKNIENGLPFVRR